MLLSKSRFKGIEYTLFDSRIAGSIETQNKNLQVSFRPVLNFKLKTLLILIGFVILILNLAFIFEILISRPLVSGQPLLSFFSLLGFLSILSVELIRLIQVATLWFFSWHAADPIVKSPPAKLKVAILTTIVPSKEPLSLLEETLRAMKKIQYDGRVDVWVLDEGNDDRVKEIAERLGVHHFSRLGKEQYNTASGEFKAKTKSGNHNSWRAEFESQYDIVAQMDPDHKPFANFLERTLGYFIDPDVAFVVAPQVYGNQRDSWLARASAEQSYIFHAIIQRGCNALGVPLLIGTNHLYRTRAWKQIGGYQDSIIEDHLTCLKLSTHTNPETGASWKGIYTPDIVSIGEGPTSWTDYFNQQKRWAYGIWEIILLHDVKSFKNLSWKKVVAFCAIQSFYPSVAIACILGAFSSFLYLAFGIASINSTSFPWFILWTLSLGAQLGFYFWLSRFNLTKEERKQIGVNALLLTLLAIPVYAAAAFEALRKKPLVYAVTAKGKLSSKENLSTFTPHLNWISLNSCLIFLSTLFSHFHGSPVYWSLFTVTVSAIPVLLYGARTSFGTIMKEVKAIKSVNVGISFIVTVFIVVESLAILPRIQVAHSRTSETMNLSEEKVVRENSSEEVSNAQAAISNTVHIVQSGESLWKIAHDYYGSGSSWPKILQDNRDLIVGPNHAIQPNMVLRISNPSRI